MSEAENLEFRVATEKDIPQLVQMRWDFLTEDDDEQPVVSREEFLSLCTKFLADGFKRGDWTYWVAADKEEIVSHIFVYLIRPMPRPSRLDDRYGYMTNVYTKPRYRNRGVGRDLMRRVKRWARELDAALLIVSPSEASVPFYRRAGFSFETEFMEFRLRGE